MASPDSDLDGSPELGAVMSRLYHWYGMGPFSRGELAAAILTIARTDRDAPGLDAYVRLFIAGLERCRYVLPAEAGGFVLSESSASYARRRAEALEREIEILGVDLDALFREEAPGGEEERKVIAPEDSRLDLHVVTRAFLADVLTGAELPPELVDGILSAYERRGRLQMSEDGGRYWITLVPGDRDFGQSSEPSSTSAR